MVRSRILIAIAMLMLITVPCSGVIQNASATSTVNFTVTVPSLGISGGFAANIAYPEQMQAAKGSVAEISYSISAASGSLTINIPLSQITLGFMADQLITIPLPQTPIGGMPIPVLQYLTGIPTNLASVNVVLEGAIAATTVSCSSGQGDVMTDLSSLKWTSWGTKSVQIQTHAENPDVSVQSVFAYTLGVGIDATFLGMKITLLSPIELSAVPGTPFASTTIQAVDPFPIALVVLGAIGAAVVVGGYVFYVRSRKGVPMPPATSPSEPLSTPIQLQGIAPSVYCLECGAETTKGGGFCSQCGKKL